MNIDFWQDTFVEWGTKKKLNILASSYVICFMISILSGIYLAVILWTQEKVFISVTLAFLVTGWILKKIVDSQARTYKDELSKVQEDYWSEMESANPKRRGELNRRMLQCTELIRQGINPCESYKRAKRLKHKIEEL